MELLPEELLPSERYKLLIGTVVPRPIAFVSTVSADGTFNLAPYSFFTAVGSNPMTLLFCPATRIDRTDKDTLRNALPPEEGGIGQFVVNVATEGYALKVAAAAEELAYGESEFELTGLAPVASTKVRPPRLAESPVSYECETIQVIRTNPNEPASGNIVLGRVLYIHVDDALVNERFHIDAGKLGAIGRMGGLEYSRTRDRFEMPRGRQALRLDERG